MKRKIVKKQRISQKDFDVEKLGKNKYISPIHYKYDGKIDSINKKVIYQNLIDPNKNLTKNQILSFERPLPHKTIHFKSRNINTGIVTCGGLCPGLNDVIRAVTYCCLDGYKVKTVYGFRYGYQGLSSKYCNEAITLGRHNVEDIHEQGGTILSSSRGNQDIADMVDTLIKFNISILFTIGGDGTHQGTMALCQEIKKRKLDVAVIGIPKTIDNDISYIHKTFGFDTAVEHARMAINAAHVEARGARRGIGLVKLMGRHSGHIAAHASLSSGNVNICLIPEEKFNLKNILLRVEKRLTKKDHLVMVVAEGVGQEILQAKSGKLGHDKSGNVKLLDIGHFLKEKLSEHLKKQKWEYTIKYIDPSYIIRSTPSNATDSSFCLRLGNYAVHAAMAGYTQALIGYWNNHFTLVPVKLALSVRKGVELDSSIWRSIMEITV